MASLSSTDSKHAATIAAIHHYRDIAASALESQAIILTAELPCQAADQPLNSLSRVAVVASNLLEEEEEEQGAGRSVQHDLQPVHAILVQLAVSLQARVDQAARDLAAIRHRLARELTKTAEVLTNLGEVV